MNDRTNLSFNTGEQFVVFLKSYITDIIDRLNRNKLVLKIPDAGFEYKPLGKGHFHHNLEVFYQISGITKMTFHNGHFNLYPGEICIMPRGSAHAEEYCDDKGPFYHLIFTLQIDTLSFHITKAESIFYCESFVFPDTAKLEVYLNDIIGYYREKDDFSKALAYKILNAFLGMQFHILQNYKNIKAVETPKVSQCIKLIQSLLNYPGLSVKYLSECLDISSDYLSFLFKKTMGVNLVDYINDERMKLAKHILRDAGLNINEVAWSCGYNDPGYFTRVFKRKFNKCPLEYKKEIHA